MNWDYIKTALFWAFIVSGICAVGYCDYKTNDLKKEASENNRRCNREWDECTNVCANYGYPIWKIERNEDASYTCWCDISKVKAERIKESGPWVGHP